MGRIRISQEEKLQIMKINEEHIMKCRHLLGDVLDGIDMRQIHVQPILCSIVIYGLTNELKQRIADAVRTRNLGEITDDFEVRSINAIEE